jgi:hypothetical protein
MIAKIAILFCGFIVAGVFLNLYFMPLSMITIRLLGIDNLIVLQVEYWICFAAASVTAFFLMRQGWPSRKKDKQA